MKLISIDQVQPGSTLGKSILNGDGQILLADGIKLSRDYINKVAGMGISRVYISDPRVDDIIPKAAISDRTKQMLINAIYQLHATIEDTTINRMLQKNLRMLTHLMIDEMCDNDLNALNLDHVYRAADYIFTHSLNVAILTTAMGINYGIEGDSLHELCMGAILHDIGKVKIPAVILNKPGKLTNDEWELIKRHSEFGYNIMKKSDLMSDDTINAIMQHHEKMDGSGYPFGLKGDEIHEYGKIIAVADVYDALTSNRSYKKAHTPSDAFEYVVGNSDQHFDYQVVDTFAKSISIYPLGCQVKLNTGEEGVVVKSYEHYHQRPTVRILRTADGHDVKLPYEINLLDPAQLSTTIKSVA